MQICKGPIQELEDVLKKLYFKHTSDVTMCDLIRTTLSRHDCGSRSHILSVLRGFCIHLDIFLSLKIDILNSISDISKIISQK